VRRSRHSYRAANIALQVHDASVQQRVRAQDEFTASAAMLRVMKSARSRAARDTRMRRCTAEYAVF